MRKLILILLFLPAGFSYSYNEYSVDLSRMLTREIFELNGIPYLQPLVETVNATSNARFFNSAYVPAEVDEPYFRVGVHGMLGFVRDDMRTYQPQYPMEQFDITAASKYVKIDLINQEYTILDTAGLIVYLFKNLLYDGYHSGSLTPPEQAATVLGNKETKFILPRDTLLALAERHPVYPFLPESLRDSVDNVLLGMPDFFSFPNGANMSSVFAFIPQLEVGSLFGTELLVRAIPPVYLGEEIGDFAFWAMGLKHSISQYFPERYFDLAVQAVYQGTYLKNEVGLTEATMTANATIFDFNIQASKDFDGIIEVYTGLAYETIDISADFEYVMPVETQAFVGLLRIERFPDGSQIIHPPEPELGYPGDTVVQKSTIAVGDDNIKWTIGLHKKIGPVSIFVDYSVSQFNIFSGGLEFRF